jgi:hypothetical protein
MAAVVEIQVQVNPTDSAAKIDGVAKELNTLGTAGAAAGQRAGAGMQQMGGHVATGLDSVRLLSQEFGLRMPRAIEAMLSRMPGVTSALSSVVGIMAGIAGVEIFSRLGEEIYKAFDMGGERARAMQKDTDDANISMRRMSDETQVQIDKLQQEHAAFEHTPSNAMKLALDEASVAADEFAEKMEGIDGKILKAVADMGNQGGFGGALRYMFGGAVGTDYEQTMLQQHQIHLATAKSPEAQGREIDSYISSLQTRLNELQNEHFLAGHSPNSNFANETNAATFEMQFAQKEKSEHVAQSDLSKAQQQKLKDDAAKAAGTVAKEAQKQQEDAIALVAGLQHEANEAGMTDDALVNEKKLAELGEVDKKLRDLHATHDQFAAAEAAIDKKYDDQRQTTLQKQINEAQKSLRDAGISGLTGLPKVEAEHKAHSDDIDASNVALQVKQIQHRTVDLTYNQQVGGYYNESDMNEAEQQARAAKEQQEAGQKALNQKLANHAEDLRYTQEAMQAEQKVHENGAMGWVASYKNAIAEIQAQEQQRLAKLTEDTAKEGLTDQEVAQRRTDIEQSANAQIAAQAEDLQHKIAGTLEQAFKDPVGTIKDIMQKMFFDILSQWISQLSIFKTSFGSVLGGMAPGGQKGAQGAGGAVTALTHAGSSTGAAAGTVSAATGDAAEVISGGRSVAAAAGASGSGSSSSGTAFRPAYSGASGAAATGGASVGGGFGTVLSSARSLGSVFQSSSPGSDAGPGDLSAPADYWSSAGFGTPAAMDSLDSAPADSSDTGIATIDTPSTGDVSGSTPTAYQTPSMNFGGGASALGKLATGAGALYSGEQATVSAFEKGQPLQGAMADAAAGAALGSVIPGIGTAIGAGVGAAVGLASGALGLVTGMAGKMGARDYYNKSIYPQIEADGATADYASGISDADRAASAGMNYMVQHFGQDAANWVKANYMDKELAYVITTITNRAKGGSGYLGASAAEFHTGGYIDGFGSLSTSSNEGYIHAMMGESVVNQQATSLHAPVINAMNSGASQSDVASMYLSGGKSNSAPSMGSGGDTHFHVHTLDTKTMTGWLRGGGARMISKAQNDMAGQYAGDGVIG